MEFKKVWAVRAAAYTAAYKDRNHADPTFE